MRHRTGEKQMSDFSVVVVSGHGYPAYRGDHEDFSTVAQEVARLVEMMCDAHGNFVDEYLFDHDDLILVFGPDGHVLQAWQREVELDPAEFQHLDPNDPPSRFLGWQIADEQGFVVQGEHDPFGLTTFAVLADEAADVAREWADGAGLSMRPMFEGEIDSPEFVYELGAPNPAP
jgi:hypothetical protein